MADTSMPKNEQTKQDIAVTATLEAGTSNVDIVQKGASVHATTDKLLRELVNANPEAAKGAMTDLRSSARTESDPDSKKLAVDAAGVIKSHLQETLSLTPEARKQQAIANVEQDAAALVVSARTNKDDTAVVMEAGRLTALVEANPEAARSALKNLAGKDGQQDTIAAITKAMQDAGVSGGKDVQPQDVRHKTQAAAHTNQLGG